MPRLIITPEAADDMERRFRFLLMRSPSAALRAREAIKRKLTVVARSPYTCRPYEKDRSLREAVIPFGKGAYLALYQYIPEDDAVYVLAFRHSLEAGYSEY